MLAALKLWLRPEPVALSVLFTSIPKSGKNLLYSFWHHLGYLRRAAWVDAASPGLCARAALHASMSRHPHLDERTAEQQANGRRDWKDLLHRLDQLPPRSCLGLHFAYAEAVFQGLRQRGLPLVFLYRNPRDVLTSRANYLRDQGKPEDLAARLQFCPLEEILIRLLQGEGQHLPFADWMEGFHGWLTAPGVHPVRFEDVVGPRGGGAADQQQRSLGQLARLAGWCGPDAELRQAIRGAFNPKVGTFSKGQIGRWREHFTPRVEEAFARLAPGVLPRWGYPEATPAARAA